MRDIVAAIQNPRITEAHAFQVLKRGGVTGDTVVSFSLDNRWIFVVAAAGKPTAYSVAGSEGSSVYSLVEVPFSVVAERATRAHKREVKVALDRLNLHLIALTARHECGMDVSVLVIHALTALADMDRGARVLGYADTAPGTTLRRERLNMLVAWFESPEEEN